MKKQGAKERILKTASELFSSKGYGNVGINEIIEKSGTAKASFYHHFPSKETLCATWLDVTHKNSVLYHDKLWEQSNSKLKLLEKYFNDLKKWLKKNDFRGCPYTNTSAILMGSSPLIFEKVEEHKLFLRDFFIQLAQTFVTGAAAKPLGKTLFLLYSGATTESQNLRNTWAVDAARNAAIALCSKKKS